MNKEEILSKSIKENKGKDLVDLEAAYKGGYVGFVISALMTTILTIVEVIITNKFNFAYYLIWSSMGTGVL